MSNEILAYISDPIAIKIREDIKLLGHHSKDYFSQKAGIMAFSPEQTYPWHLYQAIEWAKRHSCEIDDLDRTAFNRGLILMGSAIMEQSESEGIADCLIKNAYPRNNECAKFDLDFQNSLLFEDLLINTVRGYSEAQKRLFAVGCTEAWSLSLQAKFAWLEEQNVFKS